MIRKPYLFLLFGMISFSCDESHTTGILAPEPEPAVNQGIPASDMAWVSWNPEVKQKITALAKEGISTKNVTPQAGGAVGGSQTFGNTVEIPSGALSEKTFISVELACADGREQCGAEVDYMPVMEFETDVKVTLSWAYLDYQDGELDFKAYWSDDNGKTWVEVAVAEIDYDNKTLSIYVDHFTRFAWAR